MHTMKRIFGKASLTEKGFMLLLAASFLIISFIDLTLLKSHLGSDSSTYFYHAIEMWRQKSVFVNDWDYQTTMNIDSPVPLAALLYGICGNIFTAYGLANIVLTALLTAAFWKLTEKFGFTLMVRLFAANLFIGLHIVRYFVSNSLSYASVLFIDNGAYSVKVLLGLVVVICFMELAEGVTRRPAIALTLAGACVSGLSSGLWTFSTIVFPLLLWYLWRGYLKADVTFREAVRTGTFKYLTALSAISLLSWGLSSTFLHFAARDVGMEFISLRHFWANLHSIVIRFLDIQSAVPNAATIRLISGEGILYSMYFMLALLMLLALVRGITNIEPRWEMLSFVTGENLLMLTMIKTAYGNDSVSISTSLSSTRYLIFVYIFGIIFLSRMIGFVNVRKSVFHFILLATLAILNFSSVCMYAKTDNNLQKLENIARDIGKYGDFPAVYAFGQPADFESRLLRVMDSDRLYKSLRKVNGKLRNSKWGDTRKGNTSIENGNALLIVSRDGMKELPKHVKKAGKVINKDFHGHILMKIIRPVKL